MALEELDSIEADLRSYLATAVLIDTAEFLWTCLVLPILVGILFIRGHQTMGMAFAVGWLIVATVYVIGVPFRCWDRQRGRALLGHLLDLHIALADRPIVPDKVNAVVASVRTDGGVLEAAVTALIERTLAEHSPINAHPA